MSGETELDYLIRHLRPMLDPQPYVFCTFAEKNFADLVPLAPVALISETEGVTAVLPADRARDLGLAEADWYRRITLMVQSSLAAVGLTAAVSGALARAGIPANMVAAFHHDHVFVPADSAEQALLVLRELAEG
ncbi:ACT domain-containing protein [Polymorphum gilvum]|uniref:Uncharacterized protein n=1 Tax=Polymorphum gilvum (strain LMG 25793 / CGMCC 1.9160 / SL003B-26A1) TaxID=991905 RepID=F2IV07_POLGS|nr:ACT domain-containing protein [Polymorphum gilvum]ADZ70236.1 hypothetical protein SL003B_1809 [Polymorphum gilvum SL003B-26A1]